MQCAHAATCTRVYILLHMCILFEDIAAIAVRHIFYEAVLFALELRKAIVVRTTEKSACVVKVWCQRAVPARDLRVRLNEN